MVGLYAGCTFSICERVTGGASAPHPSSSTFPPFWALFDLELAKGLNPAPAPDLVGVNAGFEATGGGGPEDGGGALPAEYFAPEESATFCTIPSGVRSRSDRAVIWTW